MKSFAVTSVLLFVCLLGTVGAQVQEKEIVLLPSEALVLAEMKRRQPRLTPEEALKVARKFVAEAKIEVKDMYVSSVTFFMYGSKPEDSEPAWNIIWSTGRLDHCAGVGIIVIERTKTAMRSTCM